MPGLVLPFDADGNVPIGFRLEEIVRVKYDSGVSDRGLILQLWMTDGSVVEFTGEPAFFVMDRLMVLEDTETIDIG